MGLNLSAQISIENSTADERLSLNDLQGNILKGHGRDFTMNMFLSFDPARAPEVRAALSHLAADLTNAPKQILDAARFRADPKLSGGMFATLLLTAEGYKALGVPDTRTPADNKFRGKMANANINDPSAAGWELPPPGVTIHALLIVANTSASDVLNRAEFYKNDLKKSSIDVIAQEFGHARRNKDGEGVEQFGYVDGRSQPLFIVEDGAKEAQKVWKANFNLDQVLVPDPGGTAGVSFGSYFVFRKLEENVAAFKDAESDSPISLATALGLQNQDRERAGAMVIGRFENGSPYPLSCTDNHGVVNDFDYSDPAIANGTRCPFRTHIRKTNPRGETGAADERSHIMARRGITYGVRKQKPDGDFEESDRPVTGTGLLFMAYMADIANQFEFTQNVWANNPNFLTGTTGIDPVIGHGTNGPNQIGWTDACGAAAATANFDFKGFVKLLGGEYFFAPSLSFLTSL